MVTIHFIPGNKVAQYAHKFNYDSVNATLFDLEDSVKLSHKDFARQNVVEYLQSEKKKDSKIYIRPNNTGSSFWKEDSQAILGIDIDGVVLSKVTASNLEKYLDFISVYNQKHTKNIDVIAAIETLEGYSDRNKLMKSSINYFVVGYEDMSAELCSERLPIYENNPLNRIITDTYISSRINKKYLLGAVTPGIGSSNLPELVKESQFEKNIGMLGKFTIHPSQINIVNSIFDSKADIENAERIIKEFDSKKDGSEVIVNRDGKMEDYPSVKRALEVLQRYKA